MSAILDYLKGKQDRLIDLRVERPSLEERFLEITTTGVCKMKALANHFAFEAQDGAA